jgi:tetratricopeptide (TPR) repeat protein
MEELPEEVLTPESPFRFFPFATKWQAALVIIIVAVALYIPSLDNEYALDDGIVIHQNSFVLKGISGIGELMTTDVYHSFYERMNASDQLFGGRYRPLPSVTYAIEQELIGPYRSGNYQQLTDLNQNGVLDKDPVKYFRANGREDYEYEYNNYIDLNYNEKAEPNECFNCWDLNHNFQNDVEEDLNSDGVYNEVDCQVNGSFLRHLNNVLLYAVCCFLVFLLLSTHWLNNRMDLAFLSTMIFTIHPVHSEVVANVRGRDDLLSMIFIVLSIYFSFSYLKHRRVQDLVISFFVMLLALFSKEYSFLLVFILPLSIYVFSEEKINHLQVLLAIFTLLLFSTTLWMVQLLPIPQQFHWIIYLVMCPCLCVLSVLLFIQWIRKASGIIVLVAFNVAAIIYLGMRLSSVKIATGVPDTELLNNPFLLATGAEAFATKVFALLKYLVIFIFPHPLVSDYSYNSIEYRQLSDWDFILSIIFNLTLIAAGISLTLKRHLLGFGILFYLIFILSVSNLLFPTGTMMMESYLFHASLGLSMVAAYLILQVFEKVPSDQETLRKNLLRGTLVLMVIICGAKCWERSQDWKNDVTLFLKDVANAPNSVLVLGNAGARWVDLADTKEITGIELPGDTRPFNDYNGTLKITDEELNEKGYSNKREAALMKGIGYLKRAVELHPRYVNGHLNIGLAYYKLENDMKCIRYWKFAENLYPNNPYLLNYYYVFENSLLKKGSEAFKKERYNEAINYFSKAVIIKNNNAVAFYNLGAAQYSAGKYELARKNLKKAKALDPSDSSIQEALDAAIEKCRKS